VCALARAPLNARALCTLLQHSEKNLDNVLQSTTIYTNVSKARARARARPAVKPCVGAACGSALTCKRARPQGVLANKEDLQKVFGMTDEEKICVLARARARAPAQPPSRSFEAHARVHARRIQLPHARLTARLPARLPARTCCAGCRCLSAASCR
jgi:hypothetical protein